MARAHRYYIPGHIYHQSSLFKLRRTGLTRRCHKREFLLSDRDSRWTQSVATGSQDFVESVKQELGFLARGRQGVNAGGSYHELKETQSLYGNQSYLGKDTNTLKWDVLLQKEWQPS
jgi:hypothetical protein